MLSTYFAFSKMETASVFLVIHVYCRKLKKKNNRSNYSYENRSPRESRNLKSGIQFSRYFTKHPTHSFCCDFILKNSILLMLAKFYCSNILTLDSQWLNKTKIYSSYFSNTDWQGLRSTQPLCEPS